MAITMLLGHLRRTAFPISGDLLDADFDAYNGDFLESGRGEVLLRA
jgi:hypothetical protein